MSELAPRRMGRPQKQVINPALKTALADFQTPRGSNAPQRKRNIIDTTFYLNVDVKGASGIMNLVDSNTKRVVGITNFDGNALNAGREISIRGVRLLMGSKSETDIKNADYNFGYVTPEVKNAELRIIQGENRLIDMPVSDIVQFKDADFRSLITNAFIKSQEDFRIELEFPKGVSVPTSVSAFIRLEFRLAESKR